MNIKEEIFAGLDCLRLENDLLNLWVTKSVGPRIIGFSLKGRENMFAVLPDVKISNREGEEYHLRGGHRLWYAPESFETTYLPDDQPLAFETDQDALHVIQPVEQPTGIQKSLVIKLSQDQGQVTVDHHLTNAGNNPVDLAPWAITQLKPGGVAILPQRTGNVDHDGLLPNRGIALWPYSHINSPHVHFGDRLILIEAHLKQGGFKIGFPNPEGWLAYQYQDILFIKKARYDPNAEYYDLGSSSECFCNPDFLELETLGPKVTLTPGQTISHLEEWSLMEGVQNSPFDEDAANFFDQF